MPEKRRCRECGGPIAEEDEVWVDPVTCRATTDGYPYHVVCAPEEVYYKIVRHFFSGQKSRVIRRGLTLDQAQAYCNDPETSSSTATGAKARRISRRHGCPWFDGYAKETR